MKLLKWLSISDRFAKSYLDARFAPLGINSSQHMYLIKICDEPGILRDSLTETFYVHPSNIVRMVSALERNGFLTKRPYEKDKRTCRLYPTGKALAIYDQVQAICRDAETLLLQSLDPDERELFHAMLYRCGRSIAAELGMEREGDVFDE